MPENDLSHLDDWGHHSRREALERRASVLGTDKNDAGAKQYYQDTVMPDNAVKSNKDSQ